jgi:hypothetical protein
MTNDQFPMTNVITYYTEETAPFTGAEYQLAEPKPLGLAQGAMTNEWKAIRKVS